MDNKVKALIQELGRLRSEYTLCDKSEENCKRGKRIREIRRELIELGEMKETKPRANRRPPRVVNR